MTKTFTYDDVVRYIYSETSPEENDLILEALALNDDLMSFYLDSLEIGQQMNKIACQPSTNTVASILSYSNFYSGHSLGVTL